MATVGHKIKRGVFSGLYPKNDVRGGKAGSRIGVFGKEGGEWIPQKLIPEDVAARSVDNHTLDK